MILPEQISRHLLIERSICDIWYSSRTRRCFGKSYTHIPSRYWCGVVQILIASHPPQISVAEPRHFIRHLSCQAHWNPSIGSSPQWHWDLLRRPEYWNFFRRQIDKHNEIVMWLFSSWWPFKILFLESSNAQAPYSSKMYIFQNGCSEAWDILVKDYSGCIPDRRFIIDGKIVII